MEFWCHAAGVLCSGLLGGAADAVRAAGEEPDPVCGDCGGVCEGDCSVFSQDCSSDPGRVSKNSGCGLALDTSLILLGGILRCI